MPYEILIGLRYTRAKRRKGRNPFISFISLISMFGIALGVAALIVVLSVMNGFQKELRQRILGVASHAQISGASGELSDWQRNGRRGGRATRTCEATAPYVSAQGMLAFDQAGARHAGARHPAGGRRQGRRLRPAHESRVAGGARARRVRHRPG